MKIGILNQKGGAGKTTIALHLAHALALRDYQVMLIDADPQGSSRDWATAREDDAPFSVIGLDRPIIHKEIAKLSQGYDYVIIDGAPRVSDLTRSAILAAEKSIDSYSAITLRYLGSPFGSGINSRSRNL